MRSLDINHDLLHKEFLKDRALVRRNIFFYGGDDIILRYLISPTVCKKLDMHLIDVVTTYLYGWIFGK